MPTRLSVATIAALLAACATPYKPESTLNGGGYSEQRRGPGAYAVWFLGNSKTSEDRSEDLATLRAAELCLAEGKPFMRTGNFQTSTAADGVRPRVQATYTPRSGLEVECLAEKSEGAQEAAVVDASIRARYGIAASSTSRR